MDKCQKEEDEGVIIDMCIYTYNIRGLRDNKKRTRLFSLFKNRLKGIIFLQETHAVPGDHDIWQK
jgi:exonuclease III